MVQYGRVRTKQFPAKKYVLPRVAMRSYKWNYRVHVEALIYILAGIYIWRPRGA